VCRARGGLHRQVAGERHELAVGACAVEGAEPLAELVEVDAALGRGGVELLGDPVPVLVRRPEVVRLLG